MATKWKNMIRKITSYLIKNIKTIIGTAPLIIALCVFYRVIFYRNRYVTAESIILSIFANILLGIGLKFWIKKTLNEKYKDWIPKDESFYQEWKEVGKNLKKKFLKRGLSAFAFSAIYFAYLLNNPWSYFYGGGYHTNNASGYMLIITVLVQLGICQIHLLRFLDDKLNILMEQMQDINRRNLEKALEIERQSLEKVSRSDQLRVDLITNVSHDLKTPLTSMVGYIELIKKEEVNDVVRDYLEVVSERAQKLKEMIESLFSLAKASSGNIELHLETFEVNRLMEQIVADLKDRIDESELHFVLLLTEKNTELVSDNMYFYRICQNLLENALKYSAKATRVFIKTVADEEKVRLEITNTAGYYMDFKEEDILERFARGDKARSTEGNGLGLAIVSSYAKALGGEFEIQVDCDQFKACLVFPKIKK